jgi:hypothetical protein
MAEHPPGGDPVYGVARTARPEHILHPFHTGAVQVPAAGRVLVNSLTPGPLQGITLQIKILLCR